MALTYIATKYTTTYRRFFYELSLYLFNLLELFALFSEYSIKLGGVCRLVLNK